MNACLNAGSAGPLPRQRAVYLYLADDEKYVGVAAGHSKKYSGLNGRVNWYLRARLNGVAADVNVNQLTLHM